MARKCDTAKYRKRREREKVNHRERIVRDRIREMAWRRQTDENQRRQKEARLRDPRHQLEQRMVNLLYGRLLESPVYRMSRIARLFSSDGGLFSFHTQRVIADIEHIQSLSTIDIGPEE